MRVVLHKVLQGRDDHNNYDDGAELRGKILGPDATDRRVTAGFGASVEDQFIKQLDKGDETATAVLKD